MWATKHINMYDSHAIVSQCSRTDTKHFCSSYIPAKYRNQFCQLASAPFPPILCPQLPFSPDSTLPQPQLFILHSYSHGDHYPHSTRKPSYYTTIAT